MALTSTAMWEARSLLLEGAGSIQEWDRQKTAVGSHSFGSQREMHAALLSNSENPMRRRVHPVWLKGTAPDPD